LLNLLAKHDKLSLRISNKTVESRTSPIFGGRGLWNPSIFEYNKGVHLDASERV